MNQEIEELFIKVGNRCWRESSRRLVDKLYVKVTVEMEKKK